MMTSTRKTQEVVGFAIDVVGWDEALQRLTWWGLRRESRVVCICNVHSLVTGHTAPRLREALRGADMATPDGAPIAWMLRRLGHAGQARINGPDLMWRYFEQASAESPSIFLYGASEETLQLLQGRLARTFPSLRVAGAYSPPYGVLSAQEEHEIVERINASGAGVVWVGLGCPKQEAWMHAHKGKIDAVMVGVGAAFDFHAGSVERAPVYLQNLGLEWLFRLLQEPRRLWRRYLVTNTLFLGYAARQLCLSLLRRIR